MVPALSDELKEEAYKLRYQVYCLEIEGFSNPEDFPDKREYDEYDENSLHYLIRHRKSGEFAATARLILADAVFLERPFPLEAFCKVDSTLLPQNLNRMNLAEASRFCISKAFKKRTHYATTLTAINSDNWGRPYLSLEERQVLPHLSFALIACIIKGSYEHNVTHIYGTLEPAWFRFLASAGIHFTKIGPLTDYHGLRWPGIINVTDLLDNVAKKNTQLWDMLTDKGRFGG